MERTLSNIAPALRRRWHPVARPAEMTEHPVLREDLRVQEADDVLVLPLTPTAEVHSRADRTTLERRRVLSDLVAMAEGAPR
jgi:hypothetical protein